MGITSKEAYVPAAISEEPLDDKDLLAELEALLKEMEAGLEQPGGLQTLEDRERCYTPCQLTLHATDEPGIYYFTVAGEYVSGGGIDLETGRADFDTAIEEIEFLWDRSAGALYSETCWREANWARLERLIRDAAPSSGCTAHPWKGAYAGTCGSTPSSTPIGRPRWPRNSASATSCPPAST